MKWLALFITLPWFEVSSAQMRNSPWIFPQENRIDFAQGGPNGSNGPMVGADGGSCIADVNGQGLLSVNSSGLRNSSGSIIADMISLVYPNIYLTQAYLLVPKPGMQGRFMIFLIERPPDARAGYLEVDIEANGGSGGLVEPNITWYLDSSAAKLTAVPHANGQDYWILNHEWPSSEFHAYALTAAGLDTIPVVSDTGPFLDDWDIGGQPIHFSGPLVPSENGEWLAMSGHHLFYAMQPEPVLALFTFNAALGTVQHVVDFPGHNKVDGIEFSGNGDVLYIADQFRQGIDTHFDVWQYDLSSGDAATIAASGIMLDQTISLEAQQASTLTMSRAPNGKIYFWRAWDDPYLSVINFPNVVGTGCDLQHEALQCTSSIYGGLPNQMKRFHDSFLETTVVENPAATTMTFYPVPLSENGRIDHGLTDRQLDLEWFDASGRSVRRERTGDGSVSRRGLNAGHYMVVARQKDQIVQRFCWPVQ